jgi:pimeloyl-ACP methyl ester carboxylesterase
LIVLGSCANTPPTTASWLWSVPIFLLEQIRGLMSSHFTKMAYHATTSKDLIEYEAEKASGNSLWITKLVVTQMEWPSESDISQIKIPVLNLIGETDGIMTLESSQTLTELLPDCTEIIFSETSHNLMIEKPSEINKEIEKFLK